MTSSTDEPKFRSVEFFCRDMRRFAHLWTDVRLQAFKYVEVFAQHDHPGTEVDDMQTIRNIIEAAQIIAAENGGTANKPREDRGDASGYSCDGCGGQADHWNDDVPWCERCREHVRVYGTT